LGARLEPVQGNAQEVLVVSLKQTIDHSKLFAIISNWTLRLLLGLSPLLFSFAPLQTTLAMNFYPKTWCFVLCLLFSIGLMAQPKAGLVTYYKFENNFTDDVGNTANRGVENAVGFTCGPIGQGTNFTLATSQIEVQGPLNNEFDTEDFTMSFYFKATSRDGIQYLASKLPSNCGNGNQFYIRYRPLTGSVNVFLGSGNNTLNLVAAVPTNKCWHHLVVVREGVRVKLYLNGRKAQELLSQGRINLSNDGRFILGNPKCQVQNQKEFIGNLDEFRMYNRSLNDNEVRQLYAVEPDNIRTSDTTIFLGGKVDIRLGQTCNNIFKWSPIDGLVTPFVGPATIQPTAPGIYRYVLEFSDAAARCLATDSIRISVVDPNTLDCGQIFMANAFTPNGDGLNDTYGISNPFIIQELVAFEIFDRWGSRVFATTSVFEKWDGSFLGKAINPGVMLYRIRYRCKGEEKIATGSLMVMR
jgi:gliding motility-associated-like protein